MSNERIAVVDAHEDHRKLVEETLKDEGYTDIETADTLSDIEPEDYEIVISDVFRGAYNPEIHDAEDVDIFYTGLEEHELIDSLEAKRLTNNFPLEQDQIYQAVKADDSPEEVAKAAKYLEKQKY